MIRMQVGSGGQKETPNHTPNKDPPPTKGNEKWRREGEQGRLEGEGGVLVDVGPTQ